MGVAAFLGNGEFNMLLETAFKKGRALLEDRNCPMMEMQVGNIKDLMVVVLVDLVAYCAELMAEDPVNGANVAQ